MRQTIYTIGHSNHSAERFISLLRGHDITAVCDVRSKPYSRMYPQFNREVLRERLRLDGISYVFLGAELGARSEDPSCYHEGKIRYDRLAQTCLFRKGLDRVCEGTQEYRLALMCAEKEPLGCHRTLLIAPQLETLGLTVQHVLADGGLESQEQAIERLARQLKLPEVDLFRSHEEILADACSIQEERIAYAAG
jgi:uncharacterized protein (DUF488 family)